MKFHASNNIAESAFIADDVSLGRNNIISHQVTIIGKVKIGDNNYFAPGAVIGGMSRQRIKPEVWDPKASESFKITIGNDNLFFENSTIHHPLFDLTVIQNNISIGAHSHIGHDAFVGEGVTISVHVSVGGFSILEDFSNIGIGTNIHPRSVIGSYSMCGMGASVKGYVVPGTTVAGVPARLHGLNSLGLKRHNCEEHYQKVVHEYLKSGINPGVTFLNQFLLNCNKWKKVGLKLKEIR